MTTKEKLALIDRVGLALNKSNLSTFGTNHVLRDVIDEICEEDNVGEDDKLKLLAEIREERDA